MEYSCEEVPFWGYAVGGLIEISDEGFQFVNFLSLLRIGNPLCHLPRPTTFIFGGIPVVRGSGCHITDMSCTLEGSLTLIVCG